MVTTSTDRRAVDCPHRTSHRHGTRDAYIADHCRCPSCTAANTRWNNQRRRDLAMNRWKPYVDGGAVREHLLLLRKAGIGIDRIVGLVVSGLSGPAGAGNRRFEWPHLRLSGQVLSGLGGPT